MKDFLKELELFMKPAPESPTASALLIFLVKNNWTKRSLLSKLIFLYVIGTIFSLIFWHQNNFGISLAGKSLDLSRYFSFLGFYGIALVNGFVLSSVCFMAIPLFLTKVEAYIVRKRFIFFSLILSIISAVFITIFSGGNPGTFVLWLLGALIGTNYGLYVNQLFIKKT